jgi:hypothetical protein
MVGVTLLHRKELFYQRLDAARRQIEDRWIGAVDDFLTELPDRCR